MTIPVPGVPSPRRPARRGLYGGLVSSKQTRGNVKSRDPGSKKPLNVRVVLRDAAELVKARRGRLAWGFVLMAANRLAGLIMPGTTKYLLDDVIGKGNLGSSGS